LLEKPITRKEKRELEKIETMELNLQTIELDCPPGYPRPGDLIAGVIGGTGLESRETISRLFGNWVWDYHDVPPEKWEEIKPTLGERITKLYNNGIIRYGSW
jgi:hypothetical protein